MTTMRWPTAGPAAEIVSAATGHPLRAERVSDEAMREILRQSGMSDGLVDAIIGISAGLRDDFAPEQPRTIQSTTPTTLAAWTYDVLRPQP